MKKNDKKLLIFLGIIGFFNSIYLSLPYMTTTTTFCGIDELNTCDLVTTSKYADFFGIPNAFLGILFYLTLIISFIFWEKFQNKILYFNKIIYSIIFFGILYFIYLIYIQKFILNEYCVYCLFTALITFIMGAVLLKKEIRKNK